jgi:hypothetical protein
MAIEVQQSQKKKYQISYRVIQAQLLLNGKSETVLNQSITHSETSSNANNDKANNDDNNNNNDNNKKS